MDCPAKVSEAVATLPWVEPASIVADRRIRQVRFAVSDPKQFDPAAVTDVIARKGYRGARLLTGLAAPEPTPPQPPAPGGP